jgi:UDP-N-acetylmuramoyl-tripeptide--D-alanyl-D-alanine ligase
VKLHLSALAAALDGRLHGPDGVVDGAAIDSRGEVSGRLFVPLVAARDGHDFLPDAVRSGAGAYLTSRPPQPDLDVPAIEVADTTEALTALGSFARDQLSGPVIGVTGSVGKTSVKDLTLAACRAGGSAWASEASFNNELGVPLTLANAPDGDAVVIVEMGARGVGHIAELCAVARPTIGVVTRVALVHSELFGSIEAVAEGKGELIASLPPTGTAVLNADDPLVAAMGQRAAGEVLTFGALPTAADQPRPGVGFGPVSIDRTLRPSFELSYRDELVPVTLEARGAHMAANAAAAVAAAVAAGVPFAAAVAGLADAGVSRWRMEVGEAPSGLVVINDAYNANPTSVRAALGALGEVPARRRVAVLGAMAELGDEGPAEHRRVADEAVAAGFEVVAVAAPEYGPSATHVADRSEALARLADLGADDAVLVKGSRVAGLEAVARTLLADDTGPTDATGQG